MLNRDRLALALTQRAEKIFSYRQQAFALSPEQWRAIVADPIVLNRIAALRETYNLISWQGSLAQTFTVDPITNYQVLAVDGSQIYPDRNVAGVQCCLINIGGCCINYDSVSKASFFSHPAVIVPEDLGELGFAPELVDLEREAREFTAAYDYVTQLDVTTKPTLGLFDGSLIFWHLESKPQGVRDYFLNHYCQALDRWYKAGIPMASYISMPKHKELALLVVYGLCNAAHADAYACPQEYAGLCAQSDSLIDSLIVETLLQPGQRTTLMQSNSPITKDYPIHLAPWFFYMNVGKEIVRVEFPAWVAHDTQHLETVASICLDQAIKGRGYPVTLAEAHEQAVVKGPDRDFFYHLIRKIGFDYERNIVMSQKSIKKRGIGV
ncbi:MAG: DNA double-strand break repair nuclease NurA [Candidatus Babeliales bacterium]